MECSIYDLFELEMLIADWFIVGLVVEVTLGFIVLVYLGLVNREVVVVHKGGEG